MSKRDTDFSGLQPASEISSRVKKANKSQDTEHEKELRRELWHMGLRYRKNYKGLPGKPDIVFIKQKVAIFCDGDFWHGRYWEDLMPKLEKGSNAKYWIAKIKSNINRDTIITKKLEQSGWMVIRLWETDIKENPKARAVMIKQMLDNRKTRG